MFLNIAKDTEVVVIVLVMIDGNYNNNRTAYVYSMEIEAVCGLFTGEIVNKIHISV